MQPIFLDSKNSSSQPISASPDGFPSWCLKSLDEEILICQSQAAIKSRHISSELKAGDAQYDPSPWQKQASLFSCHTLCRPAPCCKMFNCKNPIYRKKKKKKQLSHSGKQIIHSDIIPQKRKGLFWRRFMHFTKC